ncbi:MAG: hypothetical protein HC914_20415, partial [Chloroflexaceae bacterium]|nr:hypothetical protein [Chloroflexaceae bacterium]
AGGSRAGSEAFTAPVLRSSYTVRGAPTAPTLAWSSATSPSSLNITLNQTWATVGISVQAVRTGAVTFVSNL